MTGKKLTRLLSLLLTVALVFSLVALPVYAGEDGTADSGEQEEVAETGTDSSGDDTNTDEGSDTTEGESAEAEATEEETNGESDSSDEDDSTDETGEETGEQSSENDASSDGEEEADDSEDDNADNGISVASEEGTGKGAEETGTAVAQIGDTTYTTLQNAIDAATSGATITLIANTTEDVTIPSEANITLNLGSYTLTNVSSDTITVSYGATLTIEGNGTVDNVTNACAAIYNNGTVTLNGGTYTRSSEDGSSNTYYTILNHGIMTINSDVTVSNSGNNSSMIDNGYYSYTSTNPRVGYVSGTNAANPSLTITGGTFSGGINTIKNDDCATLTISGGTFTNYTQASVQNHSTATISSGTFTAANAYAVLNCGCDATYDQGVLTISGGTFTGSYAVMDESTANTAIITITGGNFQGSTADIATWSSTDGIKTDSTVSTATISVSGGTFNSDVSAYAADGYEATKNEDGTYSVTTASAVAKIGEETYTTLATAFEEASNSDTITLLTDITLSSGITLNESKSVTLELAGHSIERTDDNTDAALITVSSGTLTVQDTSSGTSGYIDGATYVVDGTTYIGYGINVAGGTVNVNGGTVTGYRGIYVSTGTLNVNGGTVSGASSYGIYQAGGAVNVTSGSVSGTYGIYVYSGEVTVNGGTVSGTNRGINLASGTVNISNGTVSGTYYGIVQGGGTVNISSGTVSGGDRGINLSSGIVNISGGEVTSGNIGIIQFGGTLTVSDGTVSGVNRAIGVQGGTASITGGTVSGTSYGVIITSGSVEISGGTVSGYYDGVYLTGTSSSLTVKDNAVVKSTCESSTESSYTSTGAIDIADGATATINGGTITGGYTGIALWQGNSAEAPSTLNVTGGKISAFGLGISTNGSNYYHLINISGGEISGAYGMYLPGMSSTTNISGGTITGDVTGIEIRAGDLNISGGIITGEGSPTETTANGNGTTAAGAGIAVSQHTTKQEINVTITGGTITGYTGIYEINYNADTSTAGAVKITIKSGETTSPTITGTASAVYSASLDTSEGGEGYDNTLTTVEISGGTYSSDVSEYCADGLTAAGSEGVFIIVNVDAVAAVYEADGSYVSAYTTLKAAYAATPDGGTMRLVKDVSGEQLVASASKSVTLDLNGHTISNSSGSAIANSNGRLTITDSSQEDQIGSGKVTSSSNVALKVTSGEVILESGTLKSELTYAVTLSGGALTVNGGVVSAAESANCVVYYTGGTLTITDGLFTGVDTSSGAIVNAGSSATADEDNVQVKITGGVFQTYRPLRGTTINLEITGGYFASKYSLSDYIPTGYGYTSVDSYSYLGTTYSNYYQVTHTNFTLTVTDQEDAYYATLVAAVNAAITAYNSNSEADITIIMNNDYETGKVPVEKEVKFTLDLNGHTLTSTDKGAFKINNESAAVTITDGSADGTGTITTYDENSASTSTTALFQVSKGALNITSGNFNTNAGQSLVTGSGAVKISGGYFTADPTDYLADTYEVATDEDAETYGYYVADIIYGKNIDLTSGIISMNVYINDTDGEDTFSTTLSPSSSTPTYTVVENTDEEINANYVLSQNVVAKKLADTWTITVTLSNGYTTTYETSVAKYAKELLTSGTTDANEKILKAMLDYGTAVQTYSGYETSNLANGGTYYNDLTSISTASATKTTTSSNWDSNPTLKSVSMTFSYDFSIVLKYTADLSSYVDNISVKIGNATYTSADSNVTVSGQKITISGLSASDLLKTFTITVSDGDTGSNETVMSGLYYARLLSNQSSDTYQKLGKSIWVYANSFVTE